jgi:hypothetical protein
VYKKSKDRTESKQLKQKELKRQKQNKEKYFSNLKGREEIIVVQPPKLRKLQGAERSLATRGNNLLAMEIVVMNTSLCSPATVPENGPDALSRCANSLGIQVQSDVAREFSHKG